MVDKPAASVRGRRHPGSTCQHGAAAFSSMRQRGEILALAAAPALLAALSLHDLGRFSFWQDEIASVVYSSAPLRELLTIVGRDRQIADVPFMATYNVLLHFWLRFAESEAEIRLLSVVAGVAATIPVYFTGRRLGGWLAATLGALTFAAAPLAIQWSRTARSYSLAMLVSAMLTLLLLRALERPTTARFGVYGVVGALGVYVHAFVGLIIVVHVGYVVLTRSWPSPGPLLAAAIPLGLAALPFPFLVLQYGSAYGWIPTLTLEHMRDTLSALAGSVPLLITMSALIAAAMALHRHDSRVWLLLATVLVPLALISAVSTVRPLLHPRYLVVLLPSMAILTGLGLAALRPFAARVAAVAAFAALLSLTVPSRYADHRQQDWRGAAGWIGASAQRGDPVIVSHYRQLLYYLERANAEALLRRTGFRAIERRSDAPPGQLWLVLANQSADEVQSAIERLGAVGFDPMVSREFGKRITVVLLMPTE